jgi:hypothetical protein
VVPSHSWTVPSPCPTAKILQSFEYERELAGAAVDCEIKAGVVYTPAVV